MLLNAVNLCLYDQEVCIHNAMNYQRIHCKLEDCKNALHIYMEEGERENERMRKR